MSETASTHLQGPPAGPRALISEATGYWWVLLALGIAWIAASVAILQFDQASVTTVSVIVGLMFTFAGIQNFALSRVSESAGWVWVLFGVLFFGAAAVCFIDPVDTFAGLADMLGFLFLLIGIWWMIEAFMVKAVNPMWWLTLISGILMTALAFWTAGQFFIEKAYLLLVFAGIWALMEGIVDIVRAFEMHELHKEV